MKKIWDSIVIGGGPAGQSAAIYLARFNRSVLVIDKGHGRTDSFEVNQNYLGFPFGIPSRRLAELGRTQAERYGATFMTAAAIGLKQLGIQGFEVELADQTLQAHSIILATGVTDHFPYFAQMREYLGRSLFWCITCDGYKTKNKKVVILGNTDEAACTALQFLNYTPNVIFVSHCLDGQFGVSPQWQQHLRDHQIPIYVDQLIGVEGTQGFLRSALLASGQKISADFIFNQRQATPNVDLAVQVGVKLADNGYIDADDNQKTNVPFLYAAGDVTKMYAHQIASAVHEGSMAGQAANYDLYLPYQRME
jgi:thioredoxin reductase (NADPH)